MNQADRDAVIRSMSFAERLGFEMTECGPERVVIEATVGPDCCTAAATAHGGFLMSLADTAGAVGAFVSLPEGARGTTTVESKTNLVGAAKAGTRLIATATPVHAGRRTAVWTTRIETADGALVAVTTQTQLVL